MNMTYEGDVNLTLMIYEGGSSLMVSFCFAFSNSMQVGASFIFVFAEIENERSAFTTI